MTGHLLGAAGGIEAVFTVLAMRDQVAPPTINICHQDPRVRSRLCPQRRAPNEEFDAAMSNSFGFGGTNATIAFRTL